MKKQILILVLALFAIGFSSTAFGQDLTDPPICPNPIPLTGCAATNGLAPQAGIEYTYTVTVPTPVSTDKEFTWFVTTDKTFITAGAITAAAEANDGLQAHIFSTGTGYNDPLTGTTSIDVTWKYWTHDPANPVFLVIYVDNDVCTNDNIQVYIIIPSHSFTLDIANIAIDGSAQADLYATCVAPVGSALWVPGPGPEGTVQMDYGTNYMFFTVSAANFFHSWLPSFQTGGADLTGSRDVTAVHWAYPTATGNGTWTAMTESATNLWTTATPVEAPSNGTVGAAGQCIVVRITIANNQAETITDAEISLAVDGIMYDPTVPVGDDHYATATLGDLHYDGCVVDGFTNDVKTQVLSPRPDIHVGTPAPFVPKNDD